MNIAKVEKHSPPLCGYCTVCQKAGGFLQRLAEFHANHDQRERTDNTAIEWMWYAYPRCPGELARVDGDHGELVPPSVTPVNPNNLMRFLAVLAVVDESVRRAWRIYVVTLNSHEMRALFGVLAGMSFPDAVRAFSRRMSELA